MDIVQKSHNHPTVETIYQAIQKEYPAISRSTVYRNLHQLAEVGDIKSITLPDSPERFDGSLACHHHFSCKECGGIFDVILEPLPEINEAVQNTYGFQVDGHDVLFKGICAKCQA